MPHSTGPHRKRGFVLSFECRGGRGGAGRPRSPRRHRPPQYTTLAHALQLHSEYVDLKLDHTAKKEIMMARLLADNFEIFHGTGTHLTARRLPLASNGQGRRFLRTTPTK